MKKILSILTLLAISISGYAQMNTFGGIGLRVNDTTTYQTNAAAYHSAGYRDQYFNNQAATKHWDFWNGSAYEHVFSFNSNYAAAYPANEQTGNYTFVLADKDKVVVMRHASTSQTLTVPANVFPVGTYLTAFRDSTNTVTIAAGAGTFFENASGSLTLDDEDTPVVFWQEKLNHWQIWKGTAGGGGGGGHVIEDEGTPLTQRSTLNFTGAGVAVTDSGGKTVVSISGGGGGGAVASVNGQTGTVVLDAGDIGSSATGSVAATDVQAAIVELEGEKAPYRKLTVGAVFTDQPAYSASSGYYNFYPEVSTVIPRVYLTPNNPSTNGTKWKFEGFHTDYNTGSSNYAGFNLFGSTVSGTHRTWMGPNTGGTGTRGIFTLGSFSGSSQEASTSELTMNTNNTWTIKGSGLSYQSVGGTEWFGVNSSGAYLVNGSTGSSQDVLISNGSSSPPSWGVTSGNLNRVTTSTTGGTITLDMNSQSQRIHVGSASISGPKTLAMSNTTNAQVFAFTLQITNVAAVLTMPSDWVMASVAFDGTAWTPPNTGYYKFAGTFDGTNWFVNVSGPYN